MDELEYNMECGLCVNKKEITYGTYQQKTMTKTVNRWKIFKYCWRNATFGKIIGWLMIGVTAFTAIMCLAGGGSFIAWWAALLCPVIFAAIGAGGYFLGRGLVAFFAYCFLCSNNEITHEFDEELPYSHTLIMRAVKYGMPILDWKTHSDVRFQRHIQSSAVNNRKEYGSFIGFQDKLQMVEPRYRYVHNPVRYKDYFPLEELERGVVTEDFIKTFSEGPFHFKLIVDACRRMANDYQD